MAKTTMHGRTQSRPARAPLTARTADKHVLYQESVQAPEYEIAFLDKVYRAHTGRLPVHLREDFCGTALLCAEWVRSRTDRVALGLDIDRGVLDWGRAHNLAPLAPRQASRVELRPQDVMVPTREKFEAICAYNYSYSVFHTRAALRRYFRAVHRSLRDDGVFSVDAIGGWEAQQVLTERRNEGRFTYVWEQAEYDPITSRYLCHIHFEFRDGSRLKRAFTYDWRLWTLQELREVMLEAGFAAVDAFWEGEDRDGEGTGRFHRVERADNDPGWNAYLVAKKGPPLRGSPDARRHRSSKSGGHPRRASKTRAR